ncbi:hypothetical protein LINPERHAP2_LOCUS12172 [Linum perenne]
MNKPKPSFLNKSSPNPFSLSFSFHRTKQQQQSNLENRRRLLVNRSTGRRRRLQPISRLTSLSNHCSRRTRPATSSQSQSSNRLSQAFGKHSPEVVRKLIRDLLKTWRIIVASYV